MAVRKILQRSKREILLIFIFLTAALYYLGWQLTGKNTYQDLVSVRHELNSYKEEQALLLNLVENGPNLEKNWIAKLDQEENSAEVLPDLTDLPLVLRNLESFLKAKPLVINSLRIGDTAYYDHHASVPMYLKLTAKPVYLLKLLEQLELLPNLIYLDYLKWHTRTESDVELELQLQLLFYNPDLSVNYGGEQF